MRRSGARRDLAADIDPVESNPRIALEIEESDMFVIAQTPDRGREIGCEETRDRLLTEMHGLVSQAVQGIPDKPRLGERFQFAYDHALIGVMPQVEHQIDLTIIDPMPRDHLVHIQGR